MLISIIIPVYNVSEYLTKCVNSVLICDLSDCEIILVDDGSTDGMSGALCDKISSENPQTIRVIHQRNLGLGGARNTGIKEAKGDYLFFLDSDDSVLPETFDSIKSIIYDSYPDIISFNIKTDNGFGDGKIVEMNYIKRETGFTLEEEPQYLLSMPNACGRVWKKALFLDNDIRFPERVWYEDIRTTSKLFAIALNIVTIDNPFYVYYQREGSIMRSDNLERNREIIDAFNDIIQWYKNAGLYDKYREILCGLCIEHLYIAASVRVLCVDSRHVLLEELRNYIRKEFPEYKENFFVQKLSLARKLAFTLLEMKMYGLLKVLFRIKNI